MTERGLPTMEGAPACPFVAFEDDRESRAASPDHRHRCYAELVPSPRAAAHQEAYCLSSAFPVCPTFQAWAKREAARAAVKGERPKAAPAAEQTVVRDGVDVDDDAAGGTDARDERPARFPQAEEPTVHRNPPRDWAAPPPWAPGGSGTASGSTAQRASGADLPGTPDFLAGRADESRGLAGSAADRLASPSVAGEPSPYDAPAETAPDAELAGLVAGRRPADHPARGYPPAPRSGQRPSVSSTRSSNRERERERERDAIVGPSWERARRFEAYPTIRSRGGLPAVPRLAVLGGALLIAAVGLFFLPALLGVGGGGADTPTARPGSSQVVATASTEPTASPAPSAQVYVVKAGDTMSKIGAAFGFTPEELCDANKDTVKDCDKIAVGDEIVIPAKPPDEFTQPSAEPS